MKTLLLLLIESVLKREVKMTGSEKKYVSFLGYDYTQYVKTEGDVKKFERLCECEKRTKDVPLKDCVHDVAEVLNLDSELKGGRRRAHVQGSVGSN
jgi:hypothetical protein